MADPLLPPSTDLLIISASECHELLDLSELRDNLASALRAHSDGEDDVPARIMARSGNGLLGAMPGYVAGMGMAAKLVSVFPGNHGGDIPSHLALIALFDSENGQPLAVMDGTYITAVRTGASAALAADLAARADARSLAIIGAGVQGHAHARTFAGVRDWTEIRVASRSTRTAEALAATMPNAIVSPSFEAAIRGADVVALCTDSPDPVIDRSWVANGVHVSSVGIGREVDSGTMEAADRVLVEWHGAAVGAPPAGAHELQGLGPDDMIEIGDVLAGRAQARDSDAELTVYKSTGHAVEDIAAATLVYERALSEGAGTRVRI